MQVEQSAKASLPAATVATIAIVSSFLRTGRSMALAVEVVAVVDHTAAIIGRRAVVASRMVVAGSHRVTFHHSLQASLKPTNRTCHPVHT